LSYGSASRNFFVNDWIHIGIWTAAIGIVFGILWYKGQIQSLAVYVSETRDELKKCAWPSWEELKGSTALIIIMVALLGGFVVLIDAVLFKTSFHPLLQGAAIILAVVLLNLNSKRQ
jgi:preprotein translocase SecE subunit